VREELGDIFIYALTLAYEFGFDPAEIVLDKLRVNEKRYPKEKVRGKAEKYNAY
jgi:NTP pyrophosphatase (non-canonical NTP hydrolase)